MREAGVAIILRYEGSLQCLFIKRRVSPTDPWSGHIAFPGGRRKPGDKDILDTIYREVSEEVSIDLRRYGVMVYMLPPAYPGNEPELRVYPYVFRLISDVDISVGSEVERFFWVDVDELSLENTLVSTLLGPKVVEAYVFMCDGEKIVVWGMTKRILDDFFLHKDKIMEYFGDIY